MNPPSSSDNEELQKLISEKKVLSYMSLAEKAGKIASGEFSTEKSVKNGQAYLVIVADDASDNTKKMFRNMCTFYEVPIWFYSNKDDIGHAIGKEFRASLAFLDKGLADAACKQLKIATNSGGSKNVED